MLTRFVLSVFLALQFTLAFGQATDRYTIIPRPAQLDPRPGEFNISNTTTILVPFAQVGLKAIVDTFATHINRSTGISISVQNMNRMALMGQNTESNLIQFLPLRDTTMGTEGYRIDVTDKLVTVEAASPNGFFYAVQTLYQLLSPIVLGTGHRTGGLGLVTGSNAAPLPFTLPIPACRIQDAPRYVYRGMHLDVGRHFFSVAFLKKYLDLMALHKFNTFHWHLTDDQGWRIEIKKYPKLTQVGAHRRETIIGHYDDHDPQVFDGKPYSGFYTQNEIREVVRYAATKYINVVPEIEMPGHALAALAAYPELACSPGPYEVATKWGVFNDVFCPTEKTFAFLEDVLTEVIGLFPGKYVHIGGDECPKNIWRNSAFCQQLIKQKRLKNENGLQSYFISRIDKFVTAKGRRIIGWDEILEGDGRNAGSPTIRISPNATVMSWRGTKGGIDAARQGHDVIMTPGQFCYFDHFQGDPAQEPTGFGGHLPLETVYAYNPTPATLTPAQASHILGAQGNVWTEYITTPDQAEYMIWPRAAAMSEVSWTPLNQKNYDDFARRLSVHLERLSYLDINYARTLYDALPASRPTADGKVEITLSAGKQPSGIPAPDIHYTLDGSVPSGESARYKNPILLDKAVTIRTATFRNGKPMSELAKVRKEYIVSKATGKPYTLLNAPTNGRPDRNYSLTDGNTGGMGGYEVAGVVSFTSDLDAVIDLGQPQSVQSVRVGFLKYTAKNICLPKQVEISLSDDGKTFTPALTAKTNAAEDGKRAIVRLPFDFAATTARYIRIVARKVTQVPAGLRNPGKAAKLAIDEVEVR